MSPPLPCPIDDLPSADLVTKGIEDLEAGRITVEALLLMVAAPALTRLGILLPSLPSLGGDAELLLYQRLGDEGQADAYSSYNALLRSIVSFTRSLGHRVRWQSEAQAKA